MLQIKEARSPSDQEVKKEEAVLMSCVLELRGQLSVFFLQGAEAPANL
jgi:hypothetical protein